MTPKVVEVSVQCQSVGSEHNVVRMKVPCRTNSVDTPKGSELVVHDKTRLGMSRVSLPVPLKRASASDANPPKAARRA
eukprot:8151457-Pyramimonas_sp.AAC.1